MSFTTSFSCQRVQFWSAMTTMTARPLTTLEPKSSYLNLGCGKRFHPAWENLDFSSRTPGVRTYDLRKGIPFPEASFNVVYHSHVLEHLPKQVVPGFLRECHRVLRSGGVIRIVVPDLERIARLYLEALDKAVRQAKDAEFQYDWAIMEMYDQTVREFSGGEMMQFAQKAIPSQLAFLKTRLGGELDRIPPTAGKPSGVGVSPNPNSLGDRLRRRVLRVLVGSEGLAAYDHGRFRNSGEVHKWMYDRFSLAKALECAGFAEIKEVGPIESRVTNWSGFNLDTEPDGSTYKPDSLFMEAIRS